jgi:pyruvate/2-oxoglutarate dehydrogenase complex dihydrolipoamide dehydrogenase (E3) component
MTEERLAGQNFDVLVIAAGALTRKLPFASAIKRLPPVEIISQGKKPPKKTAIIGGNGVGLGLAVFLLRNDDYELTIIEESGKLGHDVNPFYLWQYVRLLKERGVKIFTRTVLKGVSGSTLQFNIRGEDKSIDVDGLIAALQTSNRSWDSFAMKNGKEIHYIGDAKQPRRLNNAIHDGYRLGMVIS